MTTFDDDNILFLCNFQGADGATAIADASIYGNDPVFIGGAAISDAQHWFGDTYLKWNDGGNGGIRIPGITGIGLLASADFYIETFFRLDSAGANDTILTIGGDSADEKFLKIDYSSTGLLRLLVSTDGVNYQPQQILGISSNGTGWKFIAIQYSGGDFCVWHKNLGAVTPSNPGTALRALQNYQVTPYNGSTKNPVFGIGSTGAADGGQGCTIIVVGEAPYPDCPETIEIKTTPYLLSCFPSLSGQIPDATLFLGDAFSKDYSYYFKTPRGDAMTYSASNLPPGLAIAANGVVSGAIVSPATEGQVYTSSISATNICGVVSEDVEFTVGTSVTSGGESFNFLHSGS